MGTPRDIEQMVIPEFEEYIRLGEPDKSAKASLWQTATGLQAVDGLKTSEYLHETARRNIEGEITLDEAHELIHGYYQKRAARNEPTNEDEEEADRTSSNIARILASQTLAFSTNGFIALHRRIFAGVFKHAGELRKYDITKKEWVLHEDTVNYINWEDLRTALDYDIEQEKAFSYAGISNDEMISHIARFVSGLWQIHPFGEGNTRTTAVFTILYLRSIGFVADNDLFARHAWYFRNALVRANYKNVRRGIDYSPQYLERFFRNLLLGEQWDLRSRYLYINPPAEWQNQPNLSPEQVPEQVSAKNTVNQVDINLYSDLEKQLVRTIGCEQKNELKNRYCHILWEEIVHNDPKELTERQKVILNLIRDNSGITIQKMTQKTKVSEKTIKRDIRQLQDWGLLSRSGGRKIGHWEVHK